MTCCDSFELLYYVRVMDDLRHVDGTILLSIECRVALPGYNRCAQSPREVTRGGIASGKTVCSGSCSHAFFRLKAQLRGCSATSFSFFFFFLLHLEIRRFQGKLFTFRGCVGTVVCGRILVLGVRARLQPIILFGVKRLAEEYATVNGDGSRNRGK